MDKNKSSKKKMLTYYEFEQKYLPNIYAQRVQEAAKKQDDYYAKLGEKIVKDARRQLGF